MSHMYSTTCRNRTIKAVCQNTSEILEDAPHCHHLRHFMIVPLQNADASSWEMTTGQAIINTVPLIVQLSKYLFSIGKLFPRSRPASLYWRCSPYSRCSPLLLNIHMDSLGQPTRPWLFGARFTHVHLYSILSSRSIVATYHPLL
jgi:hypothetical protein